MPPELLKTYLLFFHLVPCSGSGNVDEDLNIFFHLFRTAHGVFCIVLLFFVQCCLFQQINISLDNRQRCFQIVGQGSNLFSLGHFTSPLLFQGFFQTVPHLIQRLDHIFKFQDPGMSDLKIQILFFHLFCCFQDRFQFLSQLFRKMNCQISTHTQTADDHHRNHQDFRRRKKTVQPGIQILGAYMVLQDNIFLFPRNKNKLRSPLCIHKTCPCKLQGLFFFSLVHIGIDICIIFIQPKELRPDGKLDLGYIRSRCQYRDQSLGLPLIIICQCDEPFT